MRKGPPSVMRLEGLLNGLRMFQNSPAALVDRDGKPSIIICKNEVRLMAYLQEKGHQVEVTTIDHLVRTMNSADFEAQNGELTFI